MKRLFLVFLLAAHCALAQEVVSDVLGSQQKEVVEIEKLSSHQLATLNPKKAGWRSVVLPGWGQYYNLKYWKIPIVWGAIGVGVGFVIWNNNQYKRYKTAFDAERNGQFHEFSDITGVDLLTALGNAQDIRKRQRDYAIAITVGVYILNIIDAIVDAHLYEGRKDPDLIISPTILGNFGSSEYTAKAGLALKYRF